MSRRDDDAFLLRCKRALMIPQEEEFADDEIRLNIKACETYLVGIGVSKEAAESDDPLIEALMLIYVKTFYGFKADGSVKELPSSFDIICRQLALTRGEETP